MRIDYRKTEAFELRFERCRHTMNELYKLFFLLHFVYLLFKKGRFNAACITSSTYQGWCMYMTKNIYLHDYTSYIFT